MLTDNMHAFNFPNFSSLPPSLSLYWYMLGASAGLDCVRVMGSSVGGGAVVAGGSRDTLVYVWRQRRVDGASGDESGSGTRRSMRDTIKATLKGHGGWVWSLATDRHYRPNLLCSGSWDHNINVWDINTGQCACTIRWGEEEILATTNSASRGSSGGEVELNTLRKNALSFDGFNDIERFLRWEDWYRFGYWVR